MSCRGKIAAAIPINSYGKVSAHLDTHPGNMAIWDGHEGAARL